jgi:hypothetical protein
MNSLATGSFLFVGLALLSSLPALAAGSKEYRDVKSNNLFQCSTNQQIEMMWSGGNASGIGSQHSLICLDGYRKAKWVMTSKITCESPNIILKECPVWFNNEHTQNKPNQLEVTGGFTRLRDPDNTHIYNPKKIGIGTDCKIVSKKSEYGSVDYNWSCKNYAYYKNLRIITKGKEPLLGGGDLYRKYNRIPPQFQFDRSDSPACNGQSTLGCDREDYPGLYADRDKLERRGFVDCRGDAKYCNFYYNPPQ